jgi:hypothetical protein
MFADQIFDLSLGRIIQSVIRGAHVSEFRDHPVHHGASREYFAGTARYELSECRSLLPRLNIAADHRASGFWFLVEIRVLHVERQSTFVPSL